MTDKTYTKTIRMSYDNFEAALVSFLYSIGALDDSEEVIASDLGIEINDDDTIEFDLEILEVRSN